jgi:hypothetical protein
VLSFVTLDPGAALELDLTNRRRGLRTRTGSAWDPESSANAPEPAKRPSALALIPADGVSDERHRDWRQAATEAGVKVPEQLSVVGFDDGPAAEHAAPPLTTVAQPHEEKGRLAAQWLLEDIERAAAPARREQILPTELVVRESTAPPAGR